MCRGLSIERSHLDQGASYKEGMLPLKAMTLLPSRPLETKQRGMERGRSCSQEGSRQGTENACALGPVHFFLMGLFMLMRTSEEKGKNINRNP